MILKFDLKEILVKLRHHAILVGIVFSFMLVMLTQTDLIHLSQYSLGKIHYQLGYYSMVIKLLDSNPTYKDSQSLLDNSQLQLALVQMERFDLNGACARFSQISNKTQSQQYLNECAYRKGYQAFNKGYFELTRSIFSELNEYKNSKSYLIEISYRDGIKFYQAGDITKAREEFRKIKGFKDSQLYINQINYDLAKQYILKGRNHEAIDLLLELGDYKDSKKIIQSLSIKVSSKVYRQGNIKHKDVTLTFDDGGAKMATILKILNKYDIKGTFFLIASELRRNPDLWRQAVADGHLVCNHTVGHNTKLNTLSKQEMIYQIKGWESTARKVLGDEYLVKMKKEFPYFRVPGGMNSLPLLKVLSQLGYYKTIFWTREDVWFYGHNAKNYTLVENYVENAKNGDIFLMHGGSVASLEAVIQGVQAKGFEFERLDLLLK